MYRMVRFVQPLLLALVVASCGGSSTPTTGTTNGTGNTSSSISVGNNFFSPSATTVAVGTTVTWTWATGDVQHNVTFDDGTHSNDQSNGSYSRTFSAAGSYNYHCTIHGAAVMSGTVTVH